MLKFLMNLLFYTHVFNNVGNMYIYQGASFVFIFSFNTLNVTKSVKSLLDHGPKSVNIVTNIIIVTICLYTWLICCSMFTKRC